jgi:hypothetical protein
VNPCVWSVRRSILVIFNVRARGQTGPYKRFFRAVNRLGKTVTKHLSIGVVFGMAVLASGTAAQAQRSERFGRVSTAGVQRGVAASPSGVTSVARQGGNRDVERGAARADSLHPYSGQTLAKMQSSASGVPRFSTQQETPTAEVPQVSRPRTYFPGMRPSRAVSQPVTLTARSTAIPMHICTPSRSMMMGGHR